MDTASLSISSLIEHYATQPAKLSSAVAGMTPAQLAARPQPATPQTGQWSTLELLCHLCDAEQVFSDRMKRAIAMDKPLVLVFNEQLYLQELTIQHRDAQEELQLISLIRSQMSRILRALPTTAWERTVVHNQAGLLSLRQLVEKACWHLEHHTGFIATKRKTIQ